MITVHQPDVLGLGATLDHLGGSLELQIFDERDGVPVHQHHPVRVAHHARSLRHLLLLPFMPTGHTLPCTSVFKNLRHAAFGTFGRFHRLSLVPDHTRAQTEPAAHSRNVLPARFPDHGEARTSRGFAFQELLAQPLG